MKTLPGGSLYATLVQAGVPIDHHESDLYCKITPESTELVKGFHTKPFRSQVDGEMWYDIPFMYEPYWQEKQR